MVTDNIANRGSWQKMPSHLQKCSSSFPSDRCSTSELRGHREFYVETNEACLWRIKRKPYLKLAYSAGTKHPHIAMTLSNPICRKYVLFPIRGWGSAKLFVDKKWDYQTYYHKTLAVKRNMFMNILRPLNDLEGRRIITIDIVWNETTSCLYCLQNRVSTWLNRQSTGKLWPDYHQKKSTKFITLFRISAWHLP
jgi:hypothetical protein